MREPRPTLARFAHRPDPAVCAGLHAGRLRRTDGADQPPGLL